MSKEKYIEIKGARVHNLKNIDVQIPHRKITVITGLSGSGKSSLAFDTLYAEGQRRYIESLSSYARQFLGKLDKPENDYIKGISPAVAIQQKVISNNPRSTVGTSTEIYDYLKLLFARIGKTYSPISGNEVKKHSISDVVDFLKTIPNNERALIICPLANWEKYGAEKQLETLIQQGFQRVFRNNKLEEISELIGGEITNLADTQLVIDRISIRFDEDGNEARYADSIQIAYAEGSGNCGIYRLEDESTTWFNNRF